MIYLCTISAHVALLHRLVDLQIATKLKPEYRLNFYEIIKLPEYAEAQDLLIRKGISPS